MLKLIAAVLIGLFLWNVLEGFLAALWKLSHPYD